MATATTATTTTTTTTTSTTASTTTKCSHGSEVWHYIVENNGYYYYYYYYRVFPTSKVLTMAFSLSHTTESLWNMISAYPHRKRQCRYLDVTVRVQLL